MEQRMATEREFTLLTPVATEADVQRAVEEPFLSSFDGPFSATQMSHRVLSDGWSALLPCSGRRGGAGYEDEANMMPSAFDICRPDEGGCAPQVCRVRESLAPVDDMNEYP